MPRRVYRYGGDICYACLGEFNITRLLSYNL
jgi:hypothetical protein